MRVALVNPSRIRPPVAPIGLDYVAESLLAAGHDAEVLDLCWEAEPEAAVRDFFRGGTFGLVGVSIRNTDDCSFATRESFLPAHAEVVALLRKHAGAPVVLGGVGFSIMPERVLERLGADAGFRGDGEFVLPEMASRLAANRPWEDLPNLVFRDGGTFRSNPVSSVPLDRLPPMSRSFLDNRRYFREGGQAGIETKRGCPRACIYCADPVAKGRGVRLRPPAAVADEIRRLLDRGIDHFHTCDSEFNVPARHGEEVCREIVRRGLGERVRWYAYCAPVPFSASLARLMRRAGCAGINFGADSGDDRMLKALGRTHTGEDILRAARRCREEGIVTMFDLLIGAPGETRESVVRTVERMKEADTDRAGAAVGVRVYPGTALEAKVRGAGRGKGLTGGDDLSDPVFFLEPGVAPFVFDLLDDLTRDDGRFFFFDPDRPDRNYNYNANRVLEEAIRAGHRGAYWDILRRVAGGGPATRKESRGEP